MSIVTISAIEADGGGWVGHGAVPAVAARLGRRWEPIPGPAGAHAGAAG